MRVSVFRSHCAQNEVNFPRDVLHCKYSSPRFSVIMHLTCLSPMNPANVVVIPLKRAYDNHGEFSERAIHYSEQNDCPVYTKLLILFKTSGRSPIWYHKSTSGLPSWKLHPDNEHVHLPITITIAKRYKISFWQSKFENMHIRWLI